MTQMFRLFVAAGVIAAAVAVPHTAAAQDLSVEYQYQRLTDGDGLNFPLGINADVSFPLRQNLSVIGQVDWSHKSDSETFLGTSFDATFDLTAFGGGVRWTAPGAAARPFVQALVGAMHASADCSVAGISCDDVIGDTSDTNAMLQFGGGVAFPLTERLMGVGQFDYRRIFFEGGGSNSIRFVAGVRVALR